MDIRQNIELFQELVRCGSNIYTWCYDANGILLHSNCPDEALLDTAFSLFGCKAQMLQRAGESDAPITLGTAIGLIWGAAFEKDGTKLNCIWVIGPMFFSDISIRSIEKGLKYYVNLEMSFAWKHRFLDALPQLPVAQNILFTRYMLMLHYCLTGKRLDASDLNVYTPPLSLGGATKISHDRHKVWAAEQALLHMVRTGDLNYKEAFSTSMLISNGVPVESTEPLRQAKDSLIVFASIVCRAAIEGGLSPNEAYSLGDSYIQSVESANTTTDLYPIAFTMYDDFVCRVHKRRTNPRLSTAVQKCVDYIEMHLDEKIQAADLAKLVGYSEYYITRKFKDETGDCISDYVKFAKIERAKVLLKSTEKTVQDIADALGFSGRSYFSQSFRQVTGVSPADYRSNPVAR